jgi:hypothetical protein
VKTSTRTLRLIAATAAALVLMTAVAQARPMASAAGGTSTATAGAATAQHVAKANGFDWTAAAIGAGTALGVVLVVGAAGMTVRGRRRVALSS